MNITYDNIDLENLDGIVTFTEIPNILKVVEIQSGTKAVFTFFIGSNLQQSVTADSQYYITLFGETISNVMSPSNARNKFFYISNNNVSTAMSIARAFRNCGSINAAYDIYVRQNDGGVVFKAKTIGQKVTTNDYLVYNLSMGVSKQDGSATSSLYNGKIQIDVYDSLTNDSDHYLTSLEKNWYGDECAFDISPILATFSEYGKTKPYTFVINAFKNNGEWEVLGQVSGYTSIGYHANQSDKYMIASQGTKLLMNTNRGNSGQMKLYTYSNTIPHSVLCGYGTFGWNLRVSALDGTFTTLYTNNTSGTRDDSNNLIVDTSITIPQSAFTDAYYIDIIYNPNTVYSSSTRFNVIKPLRATEYSQRVEWRNEYGGISFFDFTGARSESDSVKIETYEKNVFDYHETSEFERKKIYSNEYEKSVSLTSHLMEEDGKWIFNSLMRSKKVWTTINGKKYYIIPKSIEVAEDQNYNNIFTAKLTYEYSDI